MKDVQAKLGGSTLAFVKKAEKKNAARAAKHVKYRKKDWMIGLACLGIAGINTIKMFISIHKRTEKRSLGAKRELWEMDLGELPPWGLNLEQCFLSADLFPKPL